MILLKTFFSLLLFLAIAGSALCQNNGKVEVIYGKAIQVDAVDAVLNFDNTFIGGYKFLHGVFHVKVVTYESDTLVLGMVYNLRRDKDSLLNGMGINFNKAYKFFSARCIPCDSNFPSMYGCEDNMLHPGKNSVVKKPYTSISRVFDFVAINEGEWDALKKSAKKDN